MSGGLLRGLGELVGKGAKQVSRYGIYPFIDAELARIEPGARVLSIGAGGEIGDRIVAAREKHGLDVRQLDIRSDRGADVVADICKWHSEEPYDAVVCSEVLEHLWAPHLAIDNIRASLRDGGRLILTAPFVFPIHGAPHDYFRYTRHGLEVLLREFRDVTIEERTNWAESLGVLAVRMARGRGAARRGLQAVIVPVVLAGSPVLRALGKLVPATEVTIGYNVVAFR
ncbi:MAG TPA: methyltransferase domain-containing protein [Kofleriaceae bacterium]|nr:methyltransferase domain-containing protein [Kofleriaceae bacterium]